MGEDRAEAPWGHVYRLEFALRNARNLDEVARATLVHLADLPGAARVGVGFDEGAGRRLRFAAVDVADAAADGPLPWCHIDAYDDAPVTAAARSGSPVIGSLDELATRYPGIVQRHRDEGNCAIAAVPLPGGHGPLGGLVVFYDVDQAFDAEQRRILEAVARRTGEAAVRVRALRESQRSEPLAGPDDPSFADHTHRAAIELEPDPRSAGAARRFLRETLDLWGVSDTVLENAQLCVSELVTNVVMHAGTPAHLTVHLEEGALGVLVRDGGQAVAEAVPASDEDPLRVSGRGLTLIDALADRWGTHSDAHGTIAWFVLLLGVSDDAEETG